MGVRRHARRPFCVINNYHVARCVARLVCNSYESIGESQFTMELERKEGRRMPWPWDVCEL